VFKVKAPISVAISFKSYIFLIVTPTSVVAQSSETTNLLFPVFNPSQTNLNFPLDLKLLRFEFAVRSMTASVCLLESEIKTSVTVAYLAFLSKNLFTKSRSAIIKSFCV